MNQFLGGGRMAWSRTIASAALGIALAAPVVGAQTIEREVESAQAQLDRARKARLDLIAPSAFQEAEKAFGEAERRLAKGGKIEDIRGRLQRVNEELKKCRALEEVGNVLLREAFAARGDAQTYRSEELAAQLWQQGEQRLRDAGSKLEKGDQNAARREAARAKDVYREAEYQAIRRDVLGEVWTLKDQADESKAGEHAPRTYQQANARLGAAEEILKKDRYARADAGEEAARARDAFLHAALLAGLVAQMEEDRESAPERILLGYEDEIARVAQLLQAEVTFSRGAAPAVAQILESIRTRERKAEQLASERDDLTLELAELQMQLGEQEASLLTLKDRDALLQRLERSEQRMREVQAEFTPEEADVVTRGNQIVIRMHGIGFPVGSSEIRPADFALMKKLRRIVTEFPGAPLAIEGHTDSRGDATRNQELSQQRAEAVREYLLANTEVDGSRVAAVGFGESRPVANNETEEGRAKNRRIDVRISLDAS